MASVSIAVFFDNKEACVFRSTPAIYSESSFRDHLFRTAEDVVFLHQFEQIFLAASEGNKAICKYLVQQGFSDFNAVSYGRFGSTLDDSLDGVSPLKIAERKGHDHITKYFKKCLAKTVNLEKCLVEILAEKKELLAEREELLAEREKLMQQYRDLQQKTLNLYR
jgi:hypothetical protein